jgi:hypothetical protein
MTIQFEFEQGGRTTERTEGTECPWRPNHHQKINSAETATSAEERRDGDEKVFAVDTGTVSSAIRIRLHRNHLKSI